ncbi:MAG: hypothetical protein ABSF80_05605 [Chitinispirillaceae bacterium]
MKKYASIVLLAGLVCTLHARDTWLFVRPINYYYDQAKMFVLVDLMRQEIQVQGNVNVKLVERPENGPDLESDAKARKEALDLTQTAVGLTGKVSQIDNTVFFYLIKWDAGGNVLYQERVAVPVAEDPEALVKRLAACVVTQEKFGKTGTSETIMVKETQQTRRKEASFNLYARTGMLYPYGNGFRVMTINSSYSYDTNYNPIYNKSYTSGSCFSGEFGVAYDVNFMILEAGIGLDGTRDVYFNLAGDYLFGKGDFCPYIGGEIGVAIVNAASSNMDYSYDPAVQKMVDDAERNSNGIAVGLKAGVILFRNNKLKFVPELSGISVFNKNWDRGLRFTIGVMGSL